MSAEALYNSIKSGKTKLTDLNDAGKEVLRGYMNTLPAGTRAQENKQYADQMKSAYQSNPDSFAPKQPASTQPTTSLAEKVQKPNILDKIFKDNPVMRVINRPFAKMAEMSVPDANYLGTNVNARQDFAARNPIPSTGNKTVDKVADFTGGLGSMFTPIGTGGAFINDIGKGASALLASKGGQVAGNVAGKLGSKAANAVNPMLNQLGINFSTNLASKSAQAALRGGTLGAGFGALEPFRTGDGNLQDVPKSVLENAAMFAVGDAILPFAGAGLGKIGELLKKPTPLPSYDGLSLKSNVGGAPKYVENHPSDYINSFKRLTNTEDIHSGLKEIDTHLTELEAQYTQALDGQYKFLKDSLKNRQGINQGGLINDANGEVTSRFGRTSNNPEWYQKFYKENGKVPTNKDLLNLAQEHVDKGFKDSGMDIPSWKDQVGYEDAKNSLTSVKKELHKSLAEVSSTKFEGSKANSPIKDTALNVDAVKNEPIKLTPKEVAAQERIDQFSKVEDNPVIPDTSSQIQSKTIGEPLNFKKIMNNTYIKGVDNLLTMAFDIGRLT